MSNFKAQNDELLVLSSIFDETVLRIDRKGARPSGCISIRPVLPDPFDVLCQPTGRDCQLQEQKIAVGYLPPYVLHFNFPDRYPAFVNPAFSLQCMWLSLSQLSSLCGQLENIWKEGNGEVVLYQWIQFLQEDALSFLGISNALDVTSVVARDERARKPSEEGLSYQMGKRISGKRDTLPRENSTSSAAGRPKDGRGYIMRPRFAPRLSTVRGYQKYDNRARQEPTNGVVLLPFLKDYDEQQKREEFNRSWFSCKVCLTERQGKDCMKFAGCSHIYCHDCMRSYFEIQIRDGKPESLHCPEENCASKATYYEVKDLVSPETFAKYDKLLFSHLLDTATDIVYCPRLWCQSAIVKEPDDTMAVCPLCTFVFCTFCRRCYHGVDPCRFAPEERKKIREQYMNASSQDKQLLEKQYGRRRLEVLVEESLSEDWMETCSKQCPHCRACIEKIDGCNKMTCWRCNTYFCWLCMEQLVRDAPYSHYENPASPCFSQLFHGAFDMDDDEDWQFGQFL